MRSEAEIDSLILWAQYGSSFVVLDMQDTHYARIRKSQFMWAPYAKDECAFPLLQYIVSA